MKGGLYAGAGAAATASAAACANGLDEPITNRSNVYFGFMPESALPPPVARGGAISVASGAATGARSVTDSGTRRSCPVTSRTAAPIRPRKWPSIHSLVKSFGTPRTNASSDSSAPSASANHVRYVVSFRAPLSRPATSFHRLSAVSSIGRSTPRVPLLSASGERRAYQRVRAPTTRGNWGRKAPDLQGFPLLHTALHTCGRRVTVRHIWRHFAGAGLWITLCTGAALYWPAHGPFLGQFPPSSTS